ncbi:hypothetical protein HS088_TW06G00504 [Tripterygium wilfordii]|uniref:Dihydroxy-acid/6-phosphogluconate dehydratase N-terminal domain-containing protein n=1 Tax=Tripterygium wilfordii TaxID=458696 RepID=A0A7J7DJ47_TRIWF|nr:hypothetical protein HS088_TW06G00504 [Tripterygium wilfordii]
MRARWYDGNFSIPGCDKNMPDTIIAMGQLNRPSIMIYGGTIKPGHFRGNTYDIVSAFQVALNQWLDQNLKSVISMFEDRFDLCTLQLQLIEEPSLSHPENYSWWKKFTLGNSKTISSPFHYAAISHFSMPVKRTKELRVLTGWKYYLSLYLELADISLPLIKVVIGKISDAISFFLVCLIGRSLGLIYTGIRQSLRWK